MSNVLLLVGIAAWMLIDPQLPTAAVGLGDTFGQSLSDHEAALLRTGPNYEREGKLFAVLFAGFITLIWLLVSLFLGANIHRRIRAWLQFTALVAVWLTIIVGWREIAWIGQGLRMRGTLGQFEEVADSLRRDWPSEDGYRDGLGSFMAYPQGNPRMLMMLVSRTDPQISAIERADNGSLGFEIRGEQPGTWLEWHPPGSEPATFVGGLEDDHDLNRVSPLGDGWYQVRYGQVANESPDNKSNSHR